MTFKPERLHRLVTLALLVLLASARAGFCAPNLSPLAQPPDWSDLEKYQETITYDEFAGLLRDVYCTRGVGSELIQIEPNHARILITKDPQQWFLLRFAPDESARRKVTTSWRRAADLPQRRPGRELAGLKIALDPGHIGGKWAQVEERWFQVGDSRPIQEGDMTLRVAKILAPELRKRGAIVSLLRNSTEPVTKKRPDDFREIARQVLARAGVSEPPANYEGASDPAREQSIRWHSELLFYRQDEIRARARRVNSRIKPDLVVCLHFNAEAWNDPRQPRLVDRNHFHLLVNGSYLPPELEMDDVRFEMVRRLLSRAFAEELPLAETSATAFVRRSRLPPYVYTTENVARMGASGYVYARNLLATRLYECPVIYYEPYVMNSDEVFWRVQEGDYEGIRNVNGMDRPSIYREYADGVLHGLLDHYGK